MHYARLGFAFGLFVVGSSGCVDAEDVARTRAANDFGCAESAVEITNIGGTSYRAHGCGKSAVYNCGGSTAVRGATTDYVCVPEGPR